MAEIGTKFPPQTYSSSFFINSLADEEKNATRTKTKPSSSDNGSTLLDCFISTMKFKIVLLLVVYLHPSCEAIECLTTSSPKNRIFDTILHYQGNKIPFSTVDRSNQGNHVSFTSSNFTRLPKNTFLTFDSQHIEKLILTAKQIEEIDKGAFYSLSCLHMLLLNRNRISTLSRDVFIGLDSLQRIDLSENLLTKIPDAAFSLLSKLTTLDLSKNRMENLSSFVFQNLTKLKELNLCGNKISDVLQDLFVPTKSLKDLNLSDNVIKELRPEKWLGLQNLESLDLSINELGSFDPSYNFSFYKLKKLNLSTNDLSELNVRELKRHLPYIGLIDLNFNNWDCDDLTAMIRELKDSRVDIPGWDSMGCEDYHSSTTTTTVKSYDLGQIIKENQEIKDHNAEIMTSLHYTQNLLIFVVVLIMVFLMVEVYMRAECCRPLHNLMRVRGEAYLDNSSVENFRLLGR